MSDLIPPPCVELIKFESTQDLIILYEFYKEIANEPVPMKNITIKKCKELQEIILKELEDRVRSLIIPESIEFLPSSGDN